MNVAVVDIGANTVRLLVASRNARGLHTVHEERGQVGLGEDIEELGAISKRKLARAARFAARYTALARELGVSSVDVAITSPGRQAANAGALVAAIQSEAKVAARVLSSEEEGRLAYQGAVARLGSHPESLLVCDVGGGSTQLVFGTAEDGPVWLRSVDLGSLRLTRRLLADDPPDRRAIAAAEVEVGARFAGVTPPLPRIALAAGGTARALRKLSGREELDAHALGTALKKACKRPSKRLAAELGLHPRRARTLAAGTLILMEVQRRLGVSLRVARGGLREGYALARLDLLEVA